MYLSIREFDMITICVILIYISGPLPVEVGLQHLQEDGIINHMVVTSTGRSSLCLEIEKDEIFEVVRIQIPDLYEEIFSINDGICIERQLDFYKYKQFLPLMY